MSSSFLTRFNFFAKHRTNHMTSTLCYSYSYSRRIIRTRKLLIPIYRISIDITDNIWYSSSGISTFDERVLITAIEVEILIYFGRWQMCLHYKQLLTVSMIR